MSYKSFSYYCGLVCRITIILSSLQGDFLIVLHFVKRFMCDIFVLTQYSHYRDFFCLAPASRLCGFHHHRWVHYIDTTNIEVFRFVWDCSVFNRYSNYWDLFCSGPSFCFFDHHHHGWVCYIDTKKIWFGVCHCFCFLLIYYNSFILLCFILNWPMVQWWSGGWLNGGSSLYE